MQRRLSETTVDDLVRDYLAGSSIDSLAAQLGVNRTTIISHLDCRIIERRSRFASCLTAQSDQQQTQAIGRATGRRPGTRGAR